MQPVVLHVEDNDDDAELVARVWRAARLSTSLVRVRDGAEAIEFLRNADAPPALVLLDWHLPTLGGREVLEAIRADDRTRKLPVVVFTSSDCEQDSATASRLRASGFVRKPTAYGEFAVAAEAIGRFWPQSPIKRPAAKTRT